jgi:hypothetical protein
MEERLANRRQGRMDWGSRRKESGSGGSRTGLGYNNCGRVCASETSDCRPFPHGLRNALQRKRARESIIFLEFLRQMFFPLSASSVNNSTFCQRGKCLACRHASSSHQSCPDARMGGRHLGDRPDRGRKSSAASANAAPAAPGVDLLYVQAGMERTKKRVFIFPQRNVTDEK